MAKQTIAIIGATGNMGSALAKNLAGGSYRLLLFGSNSEKLNAVVDEIKKIHPAAEVESSTCQVDACWEGDIIIPAVHFEIEKEVAERIKEVSTGKIVISISNPLNKNFDGLLTEPHTSAAEELQKVLPASKVVKAFNTVFANDFQQPVIDGKQVDVFVAGDDEEAVSTVSKLVKDAGFNPVEAGRLMVSRTLESMTLLLIQLNKKYNYNWLAGWKILHN
jgi:NADPH-dependent F420 reductase